jgi:hypothetical protein
MKLNIINNTKELYFSGRHRRQISMLVFLESIHVLLYPDSYGQLTEQTLFQSC